MSNLGASLQGTRAWLFTASLLAFCAPAPARADGVDAGTSATRAASVPDAQAVPGSIEPLSLAERARLERGGLVRRAISFDRGTGHYVGGVAYAVVPARPEQVLAHLEDVERWKSFLPRVRSARLVENEGRRASVELEQGNSLISAKYTVTLLRAPTGDRFRFWLDRSRPRDIRDVWGFFQVRPFGSDSSLVTVAAAVDVGPGVVRWLFESAVQRLVLETPQHIQSFVARTLGRPNEEPTT